MNSRNRKDKTMNTLAKLTVLAVLLTTAVTARADWVRGHFRSNGTYVAPYYRTPANGIPYDNLSYRGYPSQQPGYISSRSYGFGSAVTMPRFDYAGTGCSTSRSRFGTGLQTLPNLGGNYGSRSLLLPD